MVTYHTGIDGFEPPYAGVKDPCLNRLAISLKPSAGGTMPPEFVTHYYIFSKRNRPCQMLYFCLGFNHLLRYIVILSLFLWHRHKLYGMPRLVRYICNPKHTIGGRRI